MCDERKNAAAYEYHGSLFYANQVISKIIKLLEVYEGKHHNYTFLLRCIFGTIIY
jgi:hypothetical protein